MLRWIVLSRSNGWRRIAPAGSKQERSATHRFFRETRNGADKQARVDRFNQVLIAAGSEASHTIHLKRMSSDAMMGRTYPAARNREVAS